MTTENERDVNFETAESAEENANAEKCEAADCAPDPVKVEKAIRDSVYASIGVGVVPVALFNVAAVTANNLNLVRKLCNLYSVEFKESTATKIIASVTGAGAGTLATPFVRTAVLGIPLVGLPLAFGSSAMVNGMTTYAIGRMFVTQFERKTGFVGANVEAMKEDFKAAYKNSRQWLARVIGGKKEEEPVNA